MIEQGTYYKPVCDGCGDAEAFTWGEGGFLVDETVEGATQAVLDQAGRVLDDGRIFCESCIEEGRAPDD